MNKTWALWNYICMSFEGVREYAVTVTESLTRTHEDEEATRAITKKMSLPSRMFNPMRHNSTTGYTQDDRCHTPELTVA